MINYFSYDCLYQIWMEKDHAIFLYTTALFLEEYVCVLLYSQQAQMFCDPINSAFFLTSPFLGSKYTHPAMPIRFSDNLAYKKAVCNLKGPCQYFLEGWESPALFCGKPIAAQFGLVPGNVVLLFFSECLTSSLSSSTHARTRQSEGHQPHSLCCCLQLSRKTRSIF